MRYLYLLFFLLLGIHSHFVFADDPPSPFCAQTLFSTCLHADHVPVESAACYSIPDAHFEKQDVCWVSSGESFDRYLCGSTCSCPEGFVFYSYFDPAGNPMSGCALESDGGGTGGEECSNGTNPETGLCNNDDLCPSGYPKVNGQCPVCLEGQNEDGTCATPSSEPSASSSPDSGSAASGGSAGSAASTPSGGDDDGGDGSGPGGGGDGGNGGENGGGGSAGSASSASGGGASSGTNNSWNPYSGYGNWIPISENSPCPNKYQDLSGQWWCAGGSTGGGSSSGNTGSSGSVGSAGSSAAGECDPTSRDYLQCISTGNSSAQSQSSQSSSAASASSGAASSLGEKGEFDGEESEKKLEEIQEDLEKKIDDIKDEIQAEFSSAISGTGTIQDFCKNIRGSEVCFGMQKFESWLDPISQAIFLVACVLSFAIVLGGRN